MLLAGHFKLISHSKINPPAIRSAPRPCLPRVFTLLLLLCFPSLLLRTSWKWWKSGSGSEGGGRRGVEGEGERG